MKNIVIAPSYILSRPADPVQKFNSTLKKVIQSMVETLNSCTNPRGVGLAGPQIGISLKIFITKPTESSDIRVFINPKILKKSQKMSSTDANHEDSAIEGCLSVPKLWGKVKRAEWVKLQYQDETGMVHTETITGFLAVIVQHETDHLNGILFTQRVLEQKNRLYKTTLDENDKEVLEEIVI